MPDITIYSTPSCPYCVRAKQLFDAKGISYNEIDVAQDASLREAMVQKAGGQRTVPQIFIDDVHVGGFDDLNALNKEGKLDAMLAA